MSEVDVDNMDFSLPSPKNENDEAHFLETNLGNMHLGEQADFRGYH
jgi:hypothetical protein